MLLNLQTSFYSEKFYIGKFILIYILFKGKHISDMNILEQKNIAKSKIKKSCLVLSETLQLKTFRSNSVFGYGFFERVFAKSTRIEHLVLIIVILK